ncbi:hypothetical protein [Clostridium ihumii]|uniref:hypothetical protein n=1 Tax=Clostridium ihumii TaxID=1470356 RepID=UPI003D354581
MIEFLDDNENFGVDKKDYEIDEEHINTAKIPVLVSNVNLVGELVENFNIIEGYKKICKCDKKVVIQSSKVVANTLIVDGYILSDIEYSTNKEYLRSIKNKTSFQFATFINEYKNVSVDLVNYNIKILDFYNANDECENLNIKLVQNVVVNLEFDIYEKRYIKINIL